MAMTVRFSDAQTQALRERAAREHSSMQSVVLRAVDKYLAEDDTRAATVAKVIAEERARWRNVLDRLGDA